MLFSRQESTTANPKAVSVAYYPQTKNDKAYRLPDIPEGYYYNIIKQFNLNTYIEELYVPAPGNGVGGNDGKIISSA